MYIENPSEWVLRSERYLNRLLPIVRVALLGYVGVKIFTDIQHPLLTVIEPVLIGYFAVELLVLFHLYECREEFLRNKWMHILFLIPTLSVFRLIGFKSQAVGLSPKLVKLVRRMRLARKSGHGVLDYHNIRGTIKRVRSRIDDEIK